MSGRMDCCLGWWSLRCGTCVAFTIPAVVAGDEHVDGRYDEEGEEGADEHPADQDQTDGVPGGGASAGDQGEREMAGDRGGADHQDRPEADGGCLTNRLQLGEPLKLQLVGELDDQDA